MNLLSQPRKQITLSVGGLKFEYWKNICIRSSIYTLAREFQLSASIVPTKKDSFPIEAGVQCSVHFADTLLLTGYIDSVSMQRNATQTQVSVSGRDKTADLIDSSAQAKSSTWNDAKLEDIASDLLSPHKINLENQTDTGDKFSSWSISQGESVFECLERAATLRGVFLTTHPDGHLVIRKFESSTAPIVLDESAILDLTLGQDFSARYQTIHVWSQLPPELGSKMGSDFIIWGSAKDPTFERNRSLILPAEGLATKAAADMRAQYELNIRLAKSTKIQALVQGFKTKTGKPWSVGDSVCVHSKFTDQQPLLITSVEFTLDETQGSRTLLELQSPSALAFDPTAKFKSNPYLNLMGKGELPR
jgi:prophage tail gpP-like protein